MDSAPSEAKDEPKQHQQQQQQQQAPFVKPDYTDSPQPRAHVSVTSVEHLTNNHAAPAAHGASPIAKIVSLPPITGDGLGSDEDLDSGASSKGPLPSMAHILNPPWAAPIPGADGREWVTGAHPPSVDHPAMMPYPPPHHGPPPIPLPHPHDLSYQPHGPHHQLPPPPPINISNFVNDDSPTIAHSGASQHQQQDQRPHPPHQLPQPPPPPPVRDQGQDPQKQQQQQQKQKQHQSRPSGAGGDEYSQHYPPQDYPPHHDPSNPQHPHGPHGPHPEWSHMDPSQPPPHWDSHGAHHWGGGMAAGGPHGDPYYGDYYAQYGHYPMYAGYPPPPPPPPPDGADPSQYGYDAAAAYPPPPPHDPSIPPHGPPMPPHPESGGYYDDPNQPAMPYPPPFEYPPYPPQPYVAEGQYDPSGSGGLSGGYPIDYPGPPPHDPSMGPPYGPPYPHPAAGYPEPYPPYHDPYLAGIPGIPAQPPTQRRKKSSAKTGGPEGEIFFGDEVGGASAAASNRMSNIRRYECGTCHKRFTRPSTLRTHMNSHTGERPYSCPTSGCGWRFTVFSNLKRHMKICPTSRDPDSAQLPDEDAKSW